MKSLVALLLFTVASLAAAQELAPDAQVKKIAVDVIAIAKQTREARTAGQINELIDAKVVPYFNFGHMTALALGRNWPKASPQQQQALTSEFRALLVRTYSSALSSYKDQAIEVKPLRAVATDVEVTVHTLVRQPGSEPIGIDYNMEKTPDGWKIYDVVVGGVSLVTNYRETFNSAIRDGGVDGLIKALASKNRAQDAATGAKRS